MRLLCVASVLCDNCFGVLDIGQIGLEGNIAVEKEGDASSTPSTPHMELSSADSPYVFHCEHTLNGGTTCSKAFY
jgi:hypothetical protein